MRTWRVEYTGWPVSKFVYTNLVWSFVYFKCDSNCNNSNHYKTIFGNTHASVNMKDSSHLFVIFVGASLSFMTRLWLEETRICDALRDLVLFLYLKNMNSTHEEVLIWVKLQNSACNFTESITSPRMFFTFFKLHKWYHIVQNPYMNV